MSICNHYTKEGNWLICNICEEHICPVGMAKGPDLEQDLYCKNCTQWSELVIDMHYHNCLLCVDPFYPGKKVCLVTCSIVYYSSKEIQSICFRVYVKTPFAKLSMFFSWWLHVHRRYREKKKKIPKNWPILLWSTL